MLNWSFLETFPTLRGMIQLCRFDKPVGILLLLWPTLWALLDAAQGIPPMSVLVVFISGVILMRSAGCVINDYADRHWDGAVERTQQRPLVTGLVSTRQALSLFVSLCLLAFVLVLTLNVFTIQLSFVALGLAVVYPFTKRFTQLPQLVLGAAFSWAIPMAYAAILNEIPPQAWALFIANLCWTVAYDTQYAMVDRNDDLKVGIKSTAILFGDFDRVAIAVLQLASLLALSVFGWQTQQAWPFWLGVLSWLGLFIQQGILIKDRQRMACFQAFRANNQAGWLLTLAMLVALYVSKSSL